jgi:hypothetical protein
VCVTLSGNGSEVDVWIERLVAFNTRSDFHDDCVTRGPVLEMMAVAISCLEAGAVARAQSILTLIRYEHHLA